MPYIIGMFDRLMTMLAGAQAATELETRDAGRIAIAAILVEAAKADGVYLPTEQSMIDRILADRYGLSDAEASKLRAEGEETQSEAVDLVRFTRAVKDAVPHEGRVSVIEAVWRVVYVDDERHPEESSLIRRLCGLLYVADQDAGLARQKVVRELGPTG